VYVTLATRTGTGFLDRRLYLPRAWCEDAERRERAHIPDDITFQTKPDIAQELLARAWSEGIRSRYVTGDTLYGNSPGLRGFIAAQNRIYVLAIGSHHHADLHGQRQSLPEIASTLSNHDWESIAVTISETGPVWYDWQAVRVTLNKTDTHEQWLLIRRSVHDETSDLDFFVSNAPPDTPLADLVMVASMRHEIEQVFEEAKDQLGLADYEVRTWHGWHRHMTLCFLAHTWLMTLSHAERKKKGISHAG
jgi:SRSO17 transposase